MKYRSLMFLLQCVTILHFVTAQDPETASKDLAINTGASDSMNYDNCSYSIIPSKPTVSLLQDEVKQMVFNNDVEKTIFKKVKEDTTIGKDDIKHPVDRKHEEDLATAEKEDKETMFGKFVQYIKSCASPGNASLIFPSIYVLFVVVVTGLQMSSYF
ncbi:uncharacterized protein LOC106878719 isoform X2 [Octopus bimaculoides]|uniref:Uncharacterized protein n=2 Tax=Octopus bimaculoides TaxID=37653 RepID=A0A0L8G6X0_OCTBM|nr:uncharacterized protein LOC106878719 isoform X2 [Octopus bimaculoides]|eukprot:XP_014783512.1 PREDICTED: uncharacterized protein LOC106878719 isoform X2 [Octopus bimaculoides]